jgi:predicted component of type VI protein secretion system
VSGLRVVVPTGLCVRVAGCCSNDPQPGCINLQLHTRPTTGKPKRHAPQGATICITIELLMMGVMVPETC